MEQTLTLEKNKIKWPEIYSLAGLNAAVVISWIAYHEYQPHLVEQFQLGGLVDFLILTKAIVLVVVPPLAGYVADLLLQKNGKYFTVFTVGIGATAMVFMVVATIIGAGPLSAIESALPIMIVLWLIAMNLFISPANSMIDSFAPAQKLPVVVGFLFLITELLYALEPIVIELVHFFGDTLTFIVGGILIAGTGFLFHKVSSNEVMIRKKEMVANRDKKTIGLAYLAVVVVGIMLGVGKAFLVEFYPENMNIRFSAYADFSGIIALGLLAIAAFFAFAISRKVYDFGTARVIPVSFVILLIGVALILFINNFIGYLAGGVLTALAFGALNISGLPFAFQHISAKHITYGIGIFIGASELFTGIFEYVLK